MSPVSYGQLVRTNRNFRHWWGGQIVSQLGDWFNVITVNALLLQYTGNELSLLGFTLAQMLPGFLLGPLAGVIVDRFSRKGVMIAADLARAAIALGLLLFRGPETAWIAYACILGLQVFAAFFEPARMATLPAITTKDELVTANALSSVTWSILLTSGALAGSVVAGLFGPSAAFVLNSVSFLGSALLLAGLRVPPAAGGGAPSRGLGDLVDGFAYMRRHPQIAGALTAKLGWGLAGGVQVLLIVYGQRIFPLGNDPSGVVAIGILYAAGGLGTALGPIVARRLTGRELPRIRWAIALSFLMAGVFYACMGGAPNLGVTAAFLLAARLHGAIVWVFSTVLLQLLVEDRFRGRVFAAETSLFTLTMMLSTAGVTLALRQDWASVPQLMVILGGSSLGVGIVWLLRLLRGRLPGPAPGAAGAASEPEGESAAG
ncbi:MAG: MFS transporter [Armatimonadota bacterium]